MILKSYWLNRIYFEFLETGLPIKLHKRKIAFESTLCINANDLTVSQGFPLPYTNFSFS